MIAGSCSAIGISMNIALYKRVSSLKGFIAALETCKAEIVFRRTPVPDILAMIVRDATGEVSTFFEQLSETMRQKHLSFFDAFCKLRGRLKPLGLIDHDIDILNTAMSVMGKYDADSQAELLDSSIRRLEDELVLAKEDCSKKGKLYKAVGLSAGIMIALIII